MSIDLRNVNSFLIFSLFLSVILADIVIFSSFDYFNFIYVGLALIIIVFNYKKIKIDFYSLVLITPTIFFSLLSVIASKNLHTGGYYTFLLSAIILILFSVYNFRVNELFLNRILFIFYIIILIGSLIAINFLPLSFLVDKKAGIFINSNVFGFHLVFFLIYFLIHFKSQKLKFITVLFSLPLLIHSNSRGAFLCFFIFLSLYITVFNFKSINIKLLKIFAFTFLLFSFLFFMYFNFENNEFVQKVISSGTTGRTDIWKVVISKIFSSFDQFIFGSGPATLNLNGFSAHNSYLNETSNMGVLYVLSYMTLILYKGIKFYFKKYFVFIVVLFPLLFLGFFESILFTNSILWTLLLYLSISFKKIYNK